MEDGVARATIASQSREVNYGVGVGVEYEFADIALNGHGRRTKLDVLPVTRR